MKEKSHQIRHSVDVITLARKCVCWGRVCVCVCVLVWKRNRESVSVWKTDSVKKVVCVKERERECVCKGRGRKVVLWWFCTCDILWHHYSGQKIFLRDRINENKDSSWQGPICDLQNILSLQVYSINIHFKV